MSIEVSFLDEPKLQFGSFFEHPDTKTGLAEFGPFGKCVDGLHPSEVRLGYVGTRQTIAGAKEWVEECGGFIESTNITPLGKATQSDGGLFEEDELQPKVRQRLQKILNRDFIGFSRDTPFGTCFQSNSRWERPLDPKLIADILKIEDKQERIWRLVELFDAEIESLATTTPTPDIIVVALTDEIVEQAERVRVSGSFYLDFRRALKARSMRWGKPIQLLRPRTVAGKGDVQEKATRAWNFCTAQYYKAEGVPWRPTTLERDVCFIGISFYICQDKAEKLTMRSSIAQAFDYHGQGLILRGDPFEWDETTNGRTPHLPADVAQKLIRETLEVYLKENRVPPRRVVIHKTSEFWGKDHPNHNELDGFHAGVADVFPRAERDFVSIRQTGLRLFREGMYPPLRGTYVTLDHEQHFVYTMGYVPYLETYPGAYVPEPWQITDHHGGSAPKELLREVLALTKMNVNNCAFADGVPITLSFSRMIAEIMKHIPEGAVVQPQYRFYM